MIASVQPIRTSVLAASFQLSQEYWAFQALVRDRLAWDVAVGVRNHLATVAPGRHEVVLDLELTGRVNGSVVCTSRISRSGLFEEPGGMSPEAVARWLNVDCSAALYALSYQTFAGFLRGSDVAVPPAPEVPFATQYGHSALRPDAGWSPLQAFWSAYAHLRQLAVAGGQLQDFRLLHQAALAVRRLAARALPDAEVVAGGNGPVPGWASEAASAALVMYRHYDAAVALYRHAVEHNAGDALAWYNLATARMFTGQLEAAHQALQACLRVEPGRWDAYAVLTKLRHVAGPVAEQIRRAEDLLADGGDDPVGQRQLHMYLARLHEDAGHFAEAFRHYRAGHPVVRPGSGQGTATLDALRQQWEKRGPVMPATAADTTSVRPIFVLGMPRSGTTVLAATLMRQAGLASIGECPLMGMLVKAAGGSRTRARLDLDTVARMERPAKPEMGLAYAAGTVGYGLGDKPFIDKLPHNFLYVRQILESLPLAHVVVVTRGLMDVCWSNFTETFAPDSPFHDYTTSLESIVSYGLGYRRLMQTVMAMTDPARVHEVHYEDFVRAPDATAAKLLRACGVQARPEATGPLTLDTASAVEARAPITATRIGRWRHYARELEPTLDRLRAAGEEVA